MKDVFNPQGLQTCDQAGMKRIHPVRDMRIRDNRDRLSATHQSYT
jgi:hypothetical protein